MGAILRSTPLQSQGFFIALYVPLQHSCICWTRYATPVTSHATPILSDATATAILQHMLLAPRICQQTKHSVRDKKRKHNSKPRDKHQSPSTVAPLHGCNASDAAGLNVCIGSLVHKQQQVDGQDADEDVDDTLGTTLKAAGGTRKVEMSAEPLTLCFLWFADPAPCRQFRTFATPSSFSTHQPS